jgi:predicted SnoaL-like aldol condensation-catalyzing enzyme
MKDHLERNKRNVTVFYDLMFNQCKTAEAVDQYVGGEYIQHNPEVGDGKDAFIGISGAWLANIPAKRSSSNGSSRRVITSFYIASSVDPATGTMPEWIFFASRVTERS